jgi:hypothetical protein
MYIKDFYYLWTHAEPSPVSTSGEFHNRIAAVGPRNLNQEYIATMINRTGVNRKSRAETEQSVYEQARPSPYFVSHPEFISSSGSKETNLNPESITTMVTDLFVG